MLRDIADKLAPVHTIRCRPAGRCCGSTTNVTLKAVTVGVSSAEDRQLWVDAARRRLRLNCAKYEEYWVGHRLSQCGCSLSLLWRFVSHLV